MANSKQRRAKQKQLLKMADNFIELVEQILDEIEEGKTVDTVRCEMTEIKNALLDVKSK